MAKYPQQVAKRPSKTTEASSQQQVAAPQHQGRIQGNTDTNMH